LRVGIVSSPQKFLEALTFGIVGVAEPIDQTPQGRMLAPFGARPYAACRFRMLATVWCVQFAFPFLVSTPRPVNSPAIAR
jgi:hypothetical protein